MKAIRLVPATVFVAIISTVAVRAGGDKVAFPENYAKGVLYATIDRADIKRYLELYATPEAIEAVKVGKQIPSGTVFTLVQYNAVLTAAGDPQRDANGRFIKGALIGYGVMEKRPGWGAEYGDDIRNGEWEYQSFKADKSVNNESLASHRKERLANPWHIFELWSRSIGRAFLIAI
jgi:hypothetical protein